MEILRNFLIEIGKTGENEQFSEDCEFGKSVKIDEILENMRTVGMENESESIIDENEKIFPMIYKSLLMMSFSSWKTEFNTETKNYRKSRSALRFLVNLTQRSESFASSISHESIDLIESLLVVGEFDREIFMLLTKTANSGYLEFQKSTRYSKLIERVVDAFYEANKQENPIENDALAYFSILLEKDYAFLANCYAEMNAMKFCKLLAIVELLIENTKIKIHTNNLLFVLNLLELICNDYQCYISSQEKKYPKSVQERKEATVETLKLLIEIVGEMCSNVEMTSKLNEKATAINAVFDVLDVILHTEARFFDFRSNNQFPSQIPDDEKIRKAILEEKRIEEARKKQTDRPDIPPPPKLKRVEESETLSAISDVFLNFSTNLKTEDYGVIGELKLNCLKAIANLCDLSMENKLASEKNGRMGLLSVLQCTTRRPLWFFESYAIQKWAIFCIRQLTDECLENKEVILNLEQPAQPIINREKLLAEFGLKSVLENDKFKLRPISEE